MLARIASLLDRALLGSWATRRPAVFSIVIYPERCPNCGHGSAP